MRMGGEKSLSGRASHVSPVIIAIKSSWLTVEDKRKKHETSKNKRQDLNIDRGVPRGVLRVLEHPHQKVIVVVQLD